MQTVLPNTRTILFKIELRMTIDKRAGSYQDHDNRFNRIRCQTTGR
jgi:hypothetical protein